MKLVSDFVRVAVSKGEEALVDDASLEHPWYRLVSIHEGEKGGTFQLVTETLERAGEIIAENFSTKEETKKWAEDHGLEVVSQYHYKTL